MMKHLQPAFFLFLFLSSRIIYGQVDPPCLIPGAYLCDDIDSYDIDEIGPQSSWWTTWDGSEGDASDGDVTDDIAYSGDKSMEIAEGSTQDVLLLLDNQTSGVWRLQWQMYVPDDATGYYNFQESETPGIGWNLEVLFGLYDYDTPAPSGEGTVIAPDTYDFFYPVGQWFLVDHVVDLDDNTIELYINGVFIFSDDYFGSLGAVNFYSIDDNNLFYIDDVLLIDNALVVTYYADTDDDGYGDPSNTITAVGDPPAGYVENSDDCDDSNGSIYPGATEVCNELDDNCDGSVDEGLLTTYFADADGDDYGDANVTDEACSVPTGFVENSADCDDTNDAVYPGATEITNGIDDDCDELVDENVAIEQLSAFTGISVYPIPSSGIFTIEFNAATQGEDVTIEIYNDLGQLIYFEELLNMGLTFNKQFELLQISSGLYQVKIINGNESIARQIIIQN